MSKRSESEVSKRCFHTMFTAPLFTIVPRWEPPNCSDRRVDTRGLGHTMTTYYAALKIKAILSHATIWRNLENITLSEVSRSQKDKCCDSVHMSKGVKLTQREPERWVPGLGAGRNWDLFTGDSFSFARWRSSGDGCTTRRVHVTLLD